MNNFFACLDKKKVLKLVLTTLLYLLLLVLFYNYYLKDQMVAFMKKRTSKTVREEAARVLEFPTTTFCFHTATKLSVSKKYGFKTNTDIYNQDITNQTLATTYDSLGFQLGKDFAIQDSISGQKLRIGENNIPSFRDTWETKPLTFLKFDLQALRTYSFGTCYKLEPKF